MLPLIALYGLVAGIVVAIPMFWMMASATPGSLPENGTLYGYLTMLVAMTAVFLGIKHYRDRTLGGVIRFGRAFAVGVGISAVAGVIYAVGWEVFLAFSGFDFAATYSKMMVDEVRASRATPQEISDVMASAESFVKMYRNPWYRFPLTFIELFPVGLLISLVSAALLRNSRFLPARPASGV